MKRRDFLGGICGVVMTPAVAWARDYSDGIVRELKRNGYRINSVARTLLGRVKIVASNRRGVREIIVNPATGEILRDLWVSGGGATDVALEDRDVDDDSGSDDSGSDDSGSDDSGGDDNGGDDSGGDDGGDDNGGDRDDSKDDSKDDGDDNSGKGGGDDD